LFYVGGLGVTILIGIIAALVVGNFAAADTSTPKTWVAVVTAVAGAWRSDTPCGCCFTGAQIASRPSGWPTG
jgi:hypothetical protein